MHISDNKPDFGIFFGKLPKTGFFHFLFIFQLPWEKLDKVEELKAYL